MAREYRYLLLDVFTAVPFGGNPLAVFLDGTGLSTGEMQALARELNLSETTFCLPGEPAPEADMRVRIFTTEEELPFAGHPSLGTAAALRCAVPGLRGAGLVRLGLQAGVVPVRFDTPLPEEELPWGLPMRGEMEQTLPVWGQEHAHDAVAAALGLPMDALDRAKPVQTVSTGLPFAVVPLVSLEALAGLPTARAEAAHYLRGTDAKFFYVLAPHSQPTRWRARMPLYGGEDPATGSAAGSATAYLVRHGYAPVGTPLVIEQGVEMGRPSRIETRAAVAGPERYVRVGGSTVLVAEGRFSCRDAHRFHKPEAAPGAGSPPIGAGFPTFPFREPLLFRPNFALAPPGAGP